MTVTPMQEGLPKDDWGAEDGYDLRHYTAVLLSWWREIAAITVAAALLAGLAALVLHWLGGPTYTAWADVAIVRTVSELTLDPRFTTSSTDARSITGDATAWRNSLIGLAQGPAIAEQVVGRLGDLLGAQERIPAALAKSVEADLETGGRKGAMDSDLIRITATADTPDKAARIATAWAETYVRQVNQIYGQAPDELLASIQAEQARATADYEAAQMALEEFIAGDRAKELGRLIAEKQGVIDQIAKARANVVAAYVDAETQVHTQIAKARAEIATSYISVETQARTSRFERWLQVTRALDQARSLRGQVAAGSAASMGSGALVADLLKLQALTQVLDEPASATPLRIQLDANSAVSRDELLADIDALVQALEQRRADLERQIGEPSQQQLSADRLAYLAQVASGDGAPAQPASLPGHVEAATGAMGASGILTATVGSSLFDSTVRDLEGEVRSLSVQLEKENAHGNRLVRERDLALETLKTVNSKLAELALARAAAGSEVRLAAPAVPPAKPEGSGAVKAAAYGGTLGLLISVFVALAGSSFGIAPFFSWRQDKA